MHLGVDAPMHRASTRRLLLLPGGVNRALPQLGSQRGCSCGCFLLLFIAQLLCLLQVHGRGHGHGHAWRLV